MTKKTDVNIQSTTPIKKKRGRPSKQDILERERLIQESRTDTIGDTFSTMFTNPIEESKKAARSAKKTKDSVEEDKIPEKKKLLVSKIEKDLLVTMLGYSPSREETRFLVDLYYQTQKRRIILESQIRAINQGKDIGPDPVTKILEWNFANASTEELGIKSALDNATTNTEVGEWLKSIIGIGPVLAAGLLAYFDVTKVNYATHFHSYAGLNDNNRPWIGRDGAAKMLSQIMAEKNSTTITTDIVIEASNRSQWKYEYLIKACTETNDNGVIIVDKKTGFPKMSKEKLLAGMAKPPYNIELKKLCWKVGQSFIKVSGNPSSLYGSIYSQRCALELSRNEQGAYSDQAAAILRSKNFDKNTDAYKAYITGKLPKAHIVSRASRYAVKIFISHLFEEMYRVDRKTAPAPFFTIDHMGHKDIILPEVPYFKV